MGLTVMVMRNPLGDCTNGGLSSKHTGFVVTNLEGPFEPSEDHPAIRIIKGHVPLSLIAVPEQEPNGIRMMGGNHVYSSDGRFANGLTELVLYHWGQQYPALHDLRNTIWAVMGRPLPIHDRYE